MKKGSKNLAAYLGIALLIGSGLIGVCEPPTYREDGVDESWRIWAETRDSIPFNHTWRDYSPAFKGWKGDRPIIGWSAHLPVMEVSTTIHRQRLVWMMRHYGLPEYLWDRLDKPGYYSHVRQTARIRGIAINQWRGRIEVGPDYAWVVRGSGNDVREVAEQLQTVATQKNKQTSREMHGVIASFVQSIPYKEPASWRKLADGRRVFTSGLAVPIEVLYLKWGDCDSKTVLFAFILANFPGESAILLVGDGHMFAGVQAAPRRGDHYVRIQGLPYVLIELTAPVPVGRVSKRQWTRARKGLYEVLRVVG
jgi:hypothetical protein